MAMRSEVEIARPADEVFGVIADMSRNPEWQNGMTSCSWTSEPTIAVGSTYDQVASIMGREILTTFEVTEFEAPANIRIESIVSTFPLDITRTVEPSGEGSIVRAIIRGEPGGVMKLLGPLMKIQAQRTIRADYQRLEGVS
ncbi:MAG: SRPBCC family protein [Acidimicrobiales bacterium]|jgi:carbon monoxide dehydrogenase subunit G|nr:SRPBCC family protein [Acidimicrobiales bacterium]